MAQSFQGLTRSLAAMTAFIGGARTNYQMATGVRTARLTYTASATATVAVHNLTQIMNGGKLRACFQYSGLSEGSDDVWKPDARSIGRQSDLYNGGPSACVTLSALAVGAYALTDEWTVYACSPSAIRPWDTAWVGKNQQTQTYAFLDVLPLLGAGPNWNALNVLGIGPAGTTLVLTNLAVAVEQEFDKQIDIKSYYRPRYRTFRYNTPPGGSPAFEALWNQTIPARSAIIAQDSNVGIVPDSLYGLQLLYDKGTIFGDQGLIPWTTLIQRLPASYGGAIDAATIVAAAIAGAQPASYIDAGFWLADFQRKSSGNLGGILRPQLIGPNLKWILACQASAVAGWTTPDILTTVCEMEEVPGLTNPNKPWNTPSRAGAGAS